MISEQIGPAQASLIAARHKTIFSGGIKDIMALRKLGYTNHARPGVNAVLSIYTDDVVPIEIHDNIWLLRDQGQGYGDLLKTLLPLLAEYSAVFKMSAPTLLLDIRAEGLEFSFCEHLPQSAVYLRFSDGCPSKRLIRHELAHAFLRTNNRLLNEGLADWFSEGVKMTHELIAEDVFQRALSSTKSWDVQLNQFVRSPEEKSLLRQTSVRFVGALITKLGFSGLRRLFVELEALPPSEHEKYIEANAGVALNQWWARETTLIERECALYQEALSLRLHDSCERLEGFIGDVVEELGTREQPVLLDIILSCRCAVIREKLARGFDVGVSEIKEFDRLFASAKRNALSSNRLLAIKAQRNLIGVQVSKGAGFSLAMTKASMLAEKLLRAVLAEDPEDLETRLTFHSFLLYKPAAFGGGEAAAKEHLDFVRAKIVGEPVQATLSEAVRITDMTVERDGFILAIDELVIERGEKVGLIGHNGSGKSTLLDALLALVEADGQIQLLGQSVADFKTDAALRSQVGALLGRTGLPSAYKVDEVVDLVDSVYRTRDPEIYEGLKIEELLGKTLRQLSMGQMRRVELYLALGHAPDFIVLDEPSHGLDYEFCRVLHNLLFGAWAEHKTLLIVSHIPGDIAPVGRILRMKNGKIVESGSVAELIEKLGWIWRAEFSPEAGEEFADRVRQLPSYVKEMKSDEGNILAVGTHEFAQDFSALAAQREIVSFTIAKAAAASLLSQEV